MNELSKSYHELAVTLDWVLILVIILLVVGYRKWRHHQIIKEEALGYSAKLSFYEGRWIPVTETRMRTNRDADLFARVINERTSCHGKTVTLHAKRDPRMPQPKHTPIFSRFGRPSNEPPLSGWDISIRQAHH
jgi:hypothetical protein